MKRKQSGKRAKRTAAKSGSSAGKIVLRLIVALLLIAAVVVGGYFLVDYVRKETEEQASAKIAATIDGKIYTTSANGFTFAPGTEIALQSLIDEQDEFGVKIYAKEAVKNFSVTLDGEAWTWNDFAGTDFTKGFEIEQTDGGIKISYTSLAKIVSAVQYTDAEIESTDVKTDIFSLVITSNYGSIAVGFKTIEYVDSVELDPPHIGA